MVVKLSKEEQTLKRFTELNIRVYYTTEYKSSSVLYLNGFDEFVDYVIYTDVDEVFYNIQSGKYFIISEGFIVTYMGEIDD